MDMKWKKWRPKSRCGVLTAEKNQETEETDNELETENRKKNVFFSPSLTMFNRWLNKVPLTTDYGIVDGKKEKALKHFYYLQSKES